MSDNTLESDNAFELEEILREKEELIDALTERLELTAEQLDRLQRTNGNRGGWMSGGLPANVVEQQRSLCEDLERVVQTWEESQPTEALTRIERQLDELRDLLLQTPAGGTSYRETPARPRKTDDEPTTSADSMPPGWEALKAGLLAESPPEATDPSAGRTAEPNGPDPFGGQPLTIPEPIDLDRSDAEELRYALIARDDCIAELLRRLRSAESRTRPTDGWKALESVPADLRSRLESLEQRLEEAHRMSEVELSLERAKLGREASRLKQLDESTQKALNRLGAATAEVREAEVAEETEIESQSDGRWMRMLGGKRKR